jgi:dihydroflavonol-4-reductase
VSGQRYILGGENLTFRALVERTAGVMNLRRRFVPVPSIITGLAAMLLEPWGHLRNRRPRITYATHYCASRYHFYDSRKAHKALGYAPRDFMAILHECLRLGVC